MKENNIINGIVISDIHIGAIPTKTLRNELWKSFLAPINNRTKDDLDVVFIAGDLLDHKLSFNGEDAKLAIEFITTLLKISKKNNFKVRLIQGTKNHDCAA